MSGIVVVDASALAALLFGEPRAEEVAHRLTGQVLVAPTLLRYEITSVYLKKWTRYQSARASLGEMLGLYPQLGIEEMQADPNAMAEMAERTGLTAYDAAYLWLGQLLGAPLVTLDRRLQTAAGVLGLGA